MYYEDFSVGERFTTLPITVSEEAIIDFAERYDPQSFHVDSQVARNSIYGGLIASGWHILSLTFGEVVRLGIFEGGGQGAPGVDEVRWIAPVRPGDSVSMTVIIDDKQSSTTHPERGYVMMRFEVTNQRNELVSSYKAREIFRKYADNNLDP